MKKIVSIVSIATFGLVFGLFSANNSSAGGAAKTAEAAEAAAPAAAAKGNLENGKKLYEDAELKCATCHGDKGEGDGKKGKKLEPKPTNFVDAKTWLENNPDIKDEAVRKLTVEARMRKSTLEGGPSVGQGKGMEAYKDLKPEQMDDLMVYIKSFKK